MKSVEKEQRIADEFKKKLNKKWRYAKRSMIFGVAIFLGMAVANFLWAISVIYGKN